MEESLILIIILLFLLFFLFIVSIPSQPTEPPHRIAGRKGEEKATELIKQFLNDDDLLFTNCSLEYDGRPFELDNIIVNRYGVFIIEVKNYFGTLYGDENDDMWIKQKVTDAGNVYEKSVRNPIKQVKRQIYLLAQYLRNNNIDIWVKGYILFIENNAPIISEYILSEEDDDFYTIFHKKDRTLLSKKTIQKISTLLSESKIVSQ